MRLTVNALAVFGAVLLTGCAVVREESRRPAVVRDEEPARFDEPAEAAEFALLQRSPDGAAIPVERMLAARDHARNMRLYSSPAGRYLPAGEPGANYKRGRALSLGQWSELGPGNFGGRTRALVIHPDNPDIMYAAAVAGGIWKTTDGGKSWKTNTDLLPNIAVTTLAMDPYNPDVLYAGTGEGFNNSDAVRGAGIFKTTDGGATWTWLDSTRVSGFWYVMKVVVSPVDSNRIYAATWAGVYRSVNGGATWTLVLNRSSPSRGCQDLVIRTDQQTDYLFAACGTSSDTAVIFRNTDAAGSGTWARVFTEQDMSRTSLALAPSDQSVIYALAATNEAGDRLNGLHAVYRSTRNGDPDTWEVRTDNDSENKINQSLLTNPRGFFNRECRNTAPTFSNQGWYDNVIAVDPVNPDVVWVGGIDLFRSDDGGQNFGLASYWWASKEDPAYVHADQHVIVFHPDYDGGANQTMYFAGDGGIYRTDNALERPATGTTAACATTNSKIVFQSLNNGYNVKQFYHGTVFPGGKGYFGGSQDNGTSGGFETTGGEWFELFGGDGGWVATDPANSGIIFLETTRLSLVRSSNFGFTYTSATRGIDEPSANFNFITQYAMDPNNSKTMWIGGKRPWRTTDGASNWQAAGPEIPAGNVTAWAIAPGNSDRVIFGSNRGRIYRNDAAMAAAGDAQWQEVQVRRQPAATSTVFVSSIAFDPSNQDTVYATVTTYKSLADDAHVYKSTDGGITWTAIDGTGASGLPDTPANSIAVSPDNSSTLYVGTDMGIFVTTDGGATWAREDTGFASVRTDGLVIEKSPRATQLYAFTHGRGAWRVTLNGDASGCDMRLPAQVTIPALGSATTFKLDIPEGCKWTALTDSSAITVAAPGNGAGPGEVTLSIGTVNASTTGILRRVLINGEQLRVVQQAATNAGTPDDMASPASIAQLPYVGIGANRTALAAAADPVHSCTTGRDARTVWFSLRPNFSGAVVINASGTWNPVLTAYPAGQLTSELGCNTGTSAARIQFNVESGTTYLIQLSARGTDATNAGGNFTVTATRVQ